MAFAGVFACGASGDRDSSTSSSQSGTRRSSRKAKPTRSFFDLQASTLWSHKRRVATQSDQNAEQPPAEKIRILESGEEATSHMAEPDKQEQITEKLVDGKDVQKEEEKQKEPTGPAPNEQQVAPDTDQANQKLREQQRWLIESIKADAISVFTKIVENQLLQRDQSQTATTSAAEETPRSGETAAQLAYRLELMTRQHNVEMARLRMLHQVQLAELRHNHLMAMCEQRAALDLEKQTALAETIRGREAEHARRIDAVKSRQWCATCGKEAFFYCCWNTAYCDANCQQRHWSAHMAVCAQRGVVRR